MNKASRIAWLAILFIFNAQALAITCGELFSHLALLEPLRINATEGRRLNDNGGSSDFNYRPAMEQLDPDFQTKLYRGIRVTPGALLTMLRKNFYGRGDHFLASISTALDYAIDTSTAGTFAPPEFKSNRVKYLPLVVEIPRGQQINDTHWTRINGFHVLVGNLKLSDLKVYLIDSRDLLAIGEKNLYDPGSHPLKLIPLAEGGREPRRPSRFYLATRPSKK